MKKEIIFYAPIGKGTPPERIGGAEAGCLKTMTIYKSQGINVLHINRPVSRGGMLKYLLGMFIAPIKLIFLCLFHRNAVVHIVGFYHKTVRQEKLMVSISRFLRNKVVYEPRNGSMVISYHKGTQSYKNHLSYLLTKPDVVLCQGLEYVRFIKDRFNIERSYYPNYIMDEFIKPNNLERGDVIRLIYFGRVVEEKNIDVVIKTASILIDAGYNIMLDVIGGYNDQYKNYLDKIIEERQLTNIVTFYGRKPFAFIAEKLRTSHYYIFPSAEANEGHSNSLTEAMGCGVVPIVSTAGFNVSICGDDRLVAHDLEPESYAKIIKEIETNKSWSAFSKAAYDRVLSNYTQAIVSKSLMSFVTPLLSEN